MDAVIFLKFLGAIEKLKSNTRHSWTADGVPETVAAHSWRLAVMALLLRDEFPDADMGRVADMCLIHDWGEAVTGDIPVFLKGEKDDAAERYAVEGLLLMFPESIRARFAAMFREIEDQESVESRIFKALDKLEAVISHNEASLDTWIPLEHELNLKYGERECSEFEILRELREESRRISVRKLDGR